MLYHVFCYPRTDTYAISAAELYGAANPNFFFSWISTIIKKPTQTMPPSIRPIILLPAQRLLFSRQVFQISPFLLPYLHNHQQHQQQRAASILSNLSDNPGAYNKKIRRGRGPSSGKGKTSGRGHKGQKQHGKVPFGFNGGQTKDEDTNPIRGLNNRTAK